MVGATKGKRYFPTKESEACITLYALMTEKKKFLLLDVQDVINIINEEEDWAIKKLVERHFGSV